jgi:hypothetical protein
MKILKFNSKLLPMMMLCIIMVMLSNCKGFVNFKDQILITGTETNPMVKFPVQEAGASISVTAYATNVVDNNITVNFAVDTSLVTTYNNENGGSYVPAPASSYVLSTNSGVITAGTNVSSPITVRVTSMDSLKDGVTYLIPITIKSVTGPLSVLEASRTIYLRIARVYTFNAIDLTNTKFYYQYNFTNPDSDITQFTFEIKCNITAWHTGSPPISRLCNWGPADQLTFNLLRFGESGSAQNQLQWINSSGSVFSNTLFATGQWYMISCVYTGTECDLYINGVLDSEFPAQNQVYDWGALELGMSYAGYQTAQEFLGLAGEVRFWNRPLTATEIQAGLCGVDAAAPGLVSYWKLNEGEGNTFYDLTGNGRNMTWPVAPTWNLSLTNLCAQ